MYLQFVQKLYLLPFKYVADATLLLPDEPDTGLDTEFNSKKIRQLREIALLFHILTTLTSNASVRTHISCSG